MSKILAADIIVKHHFPNICTQEDLDEDGWTLEDMVRHLIEEEGLMGIVDDMRGEIISITEAE